MQILSKSLPKHVAIIMDGNGRWASGRGLPRVEGHREGSNAIKRLLDTSLEIGLKVISLYAFSTENWKRPPSEIHSIYSLLEEFIDKELDDIHRKGVKIIHSGSRDKIPKNSLKKVDLAIEQTQKNKSIIVNFCLNYGSHAEIVHSVNEVLKERSNKEKPLDTKIKEKDIENHLYTYHLPDVDLLIRTGGEKRLSNFLLWQSAYAELYFTDVLWPDFDKDSLHTALDWFKSRVRKFGDVKQK